MSFSFTQLLVSSISGAIGFVCFIYGKKMASWKPMVAGVCICVLPYLVQSWEWVTAGTVVLLIVLYIYRD